MLSRLQSSFTIFPPFIFSILQMIISILYNPAWMKDDSVCKLRNEYPQFNYIEAEQDFSFTSESV